MRGLVIVSTESHAQRSPPSAGTVTKPTPVSWESLPILETSKTQNATGLKVTAIALGSTLGYISTCWVIVSHPSISCLGFTLYKNDYFGIWIETTTSMDYVNNVFIENSVGLWTLVVGPASLSHARHNKEVKVIGGETTIFN